MKEIPAHSPLRLASYNIRKCVGTDRRRDPDRVLEVVAGLGADVVALQEADLRLGARRSALDPERIEMRTGLRAVPMRHNDVSLGWHGNAVLLAPGIEAEEIAPLDLPGLEPRGALRIDLWRGPEALRLVAVHLGLRRRDRRRQMFAIRTALKALPEKPTAIAGDFNEWSLNRGMEPLDGAFDVHSPSASYHARWPVAPLDRIATSTELALQNAGVGETRLAKRASDHLPLWADIAAAS
ncbi:MAG: endonuclease/exonuclease/phosphatase family protein [Paracoccaceae bacterium]|nr:endonuclease/exonuclease/phosphatase family protein [Paracoccaceae bacterium]